MTSKEIAFNILEVGAGIFVGLADEASDVVYVVYEDFDIPVMRYLCGLFVIIQPLWYYFIFLMYYTSNVKIRINPVMKIVRGFLLALVYALLMELRLLSGVRVINRAFSRFAGLPLEDFRLLNMENCWRLNIIFEIFLESFPQFILQTANNFMNGWSIIGIVSAIITFISIFRDLMVLSNFLVFSLIENEKGLTMRPLTSLGDRIKLLEAIEDGKPGIVKNILKSETARPEVKDEHKNSLLHLACQKGDVEITKFLLENYRNAVEIYLENDEKKTAMDLAIEGDHLECVEALHQEGHFNIILRRNKDSFGLLYHAAGLSDLSIAKYFTRQGLILNQKEKKSLMSTVLQEGNIELAKFLHEHDFDFNEKNVYGMNYIHQAVIENQPELIEYLKTIGLDIKETTEKGQNALHFASQLQTDEMMKYLVLSKEVPYIKDVLSYEPIHIAAEKGSLEVVKFLRDIGKDITALGPEGKDCVILAIESQQLETVKFLRTHNKSNELFPLHSAARVGNRKIFALLERQGCSSTEVNHQGMDTMEVAIHYGQIDIISDLKLGGYDMKRRKGENEDTLMHLAVESGHIRVLRFLHSEASLSYRLTNNKGQTIVHLACEKGLLDIVKFLDKEGCNLDQKDDVGDSPIFYAIQSGYLNVVDYLFKADIKLDQTDHRHRSCIIAAAAAGQLELLQYIHESGKVELTAKDDEDNSLWHFGVESGSIPILDYLCRFSKERDQVNIRGQTALHLAVIKQEVQIVQFLCSEGFDHTLQDSEGRNSTNLAVESGNIEILQFLKGRGVDFKTKSSGGWSLLELAVHHGHLRVVEFLQESNVNINARDAKNGFLIHKAVKGGHLHVIEDLVCQGLDIDLKDFEGKTPLLVAAECGHLHIMKYLIGQKADIFQTDLNGRNMMHAAAWGGSTEVFEYLYDSELMNIYDRDNYGNTGLHVAVLNGQLTMLKYLYEDTDLGVDLLDKNKQGHTIVQLAVEGDHLEILQFLKSVKVSMKGARKNGETVLHIAARSGSLEMVQFLVGCSLGVNDCDIHGKNTAHFACIGGSADILQFLLQKGVKYQKKDDFGNSPVHFACQKGHLECVQVLHAKGGINYQDTDGFKRNALHMATESGNKDLVSFICENGSIPSAKTRDQYSRAAINIASTKGMHEIVEYLLDRSEYLTEESIVEKLPDETKTQLYNHRSSMRAKEEENKDKNGSDEDIQLIIKDDSDSK
eukprot:CAMPEP_0115019876 /NCGR_PEP_ID=MMETSP0216-20121206/29740_1 /TAXON_ID=223996 /ORGANISM="Protocruzia adherens, Strain Boccale" /LENGTH=1212 /DNA_ID=CAMNT_0002391501 /DNA_START=210 /DNA_END=3848 /DNA_ORIENTATION=+